MVPEELKYSREHEWVKVNAGTATIGITDFAQQELGDIVFTELPDEGASIQQMEEFGVVESVKTVSNLYSPVSGEVVEINEAVIRKPELINEDPYGKGWIIKVKVKEPKELDKLLSSEDYQELIGAAD